jgi:DNA-binding XRE family transcriptional regulator
MKKDKKERLEKAGWRVGSTRDFLDLSNAELAVIEVRVMLARTLKSCRIRRHMSQAALAKELGSSQSRVAKMEAGDPSVSLDLLVRSLFALGSTTAQVGKAIAGANAA